MHQKVKLKEVKNLMSDPTSILIDVLPEEEYQKSHIQGAINIPLDRIAQTCRKTYSSEQILIVYCSDNKCAASTLAAHKLTILGFSNVFEYPGGKKNWQEAGLPLVYNTKNF